MAALVLKRAELEKQLNAKAASAGGRGSAERGLEAAVLEIV
jgi:hypothetical protein